ncbi:hypothetical protein [Macrococcus animalis]|uniref:hypothetical protein n=1 Tax=Macrococcus animalis TaxID=3395467 RepID=UPI0039BE227D
MIRFNAETGFILVGLYNIFSILIFSKFFTNPLLFQYDPAVFSWVGQISILFWGIAYIVISHKYTKVPYLVLFFAIEKALYVFVWSDWLIGDSNRLSELSTQPLTALFFSIYGIGDLISCIFFAIVAYRLMTNK